MSDQLHDKILSCDDLATKTLPQLEKMKEFYDIKINDLKEQNSVFKYQQWLYNHKKLHALFLTSSIGLFVISFYLTLKVTKYAAILSIFSIVYILTTGVFVNDVRNQAITKNIATINYMIQTFKEKDNERKTNNLFRRKARIVYECIRNASNSRINGSDLMKAVKKYDSKMDKNTLKKVLEEDLIEVVIKEEEPYSTSSRDLSNTSVYKLKNL